MQEKNRMRLLALVAAATLATAGLIASPAAARPNHGHGHGHGWHGNGHGWHGGHHRRCTTTWRHHHRVRRCW
jgi:Spy/CpxP family protein refolding chaperone